MENAWQFWFITLLFLPLFFNFLPLARMVLCWCYGTAAAVSDFSQEIKRFAYFSNPTLYFAFRDPITFHSTRRDK